MEKRDRLEVDGEVLESCKSIFKVQTDCGLVTATLSGKIRKNSIKILVGDKVKVELSPLETSKGRIIHRYMPERTQQPQRR